jgi:hypothetical protein
MGERNNMNWMRIIMGGILAGIVLFVVPGATNGAILGEDWQVWLKAMGPLNHAPSQGVGMLLWLVVSVLLGITGVWVYAAVRSKFTPGPVSALKVGLVLWICAFLTPALGNFALGAYPQKIIMIGCLGGLVGSVLSMPAGGWLYRD